VNICISPTSCRCCFDDEQWDRRARQQCQALCSPDELLKVLNALLSPKNHCPGTTEVTAPNEKHSGRYSRQYLRRRPHDMAQRSPKTQQEARYHASRALKVVPALLSERTTDWP